MKRFFVRLLLFLAAIVLLDQLFGFAMASILKNTEKGDWGRNNYIFNDVKSDVVILGSSRAIHHYDPRIISDSLGMSCYNCGEDGMGILLMYPRFQAMLNRYTPRLVIYEFLPSFDLEKETDNLKYLKFLRPYTSNPAVDTISHSISTTEPIKLLSGCYRYNSVFVDIFAQSVSKSSETAKDYSYAPENKQMAEETSILCQDANEVGHNKKITIDSLKFHYLEALITQCNKDGVKLVFTASPMYGAPSDKDYKVLKDLCVKYDVPFINHYADARLCNNSDFFADVAHLNQGGAEKFTSMIASEIKGVLMR